MKKWSDEETKYLKVNYGKIKLCDIVIALGRTRDSVSNKAKMLGIRRRVPFLPTKKPHEMDKKAWAKVVGYVVGDGSVYEYWHIDHQRYVVEFCNTNENLMNDYCNNFVAAFGVRLRVRTEKRLTRGGKKVFKAEVRRREIYERLKFAKGSFTWKLPNELKEDRELFEMFLKAYFAADGSKGKDKGLFSVNLNGLREICELIQKFYGISLKIHPGHRCYRIFLPRVLKCISNGDAPSVNSAHGTSSSNLGRPPLSEVPKQALGAPQGD